MLQRVAVCYRMAPMNRLSQLAGLSCKRAHCGTLRHTAAHCGTLQHTAAHCSTLQHTAAHCSTLQHTAARCSTLQHTVPHRTKPQHSDLEDLILPTIINTHINTRLRHISSYCFVRCVLSSSMRQPLTSSTFAIQQAQRRARPPRTRASKHCITNFHFQQFV